MRKIADYEISLDPSLNGGDIPHIVVEKSVQWILFPSHVNLVMMEEEVHRH